MHKHLKIGKEANADSLSARGKVIIIIPTKCHIISQ